ncbi:MAG TPA: DUF4124 domain-containing protein [Rhodanobacteraceae bacterium]|nr:DUF4124 domain-containing protein [Rhodanobacteraceae bacterium]
MRRTALFILLALAFALPAFGTGDVYRWKDAKGVVHFADAPPPDGIKYKIVNLSTGAERDPPPPPAIPATTPKPAAAATLGGNKMMKDTPENRARLCGVLKERIALLDSDKSLTLAADSSKLMPAEERAKELAESKAQQAQYCTSAKP